MMQTTDREFWLARTTAGDKGDKVEVAYPISRDRYARYTTVKGDEADVFDHVAWLIQCDGCTLMYEHMLKKVLSITYDTGTKQTTVLLYNTLYAGD